MTAESNPQKRRPERPPSRVDGIGWGFKGTPSDRAYLETVLLPGLAQTGSAMLFVGVAPYTDRYKDIVGPGFVTTDPARPDLADFTLDFSHPEFPSQIRAGLVKKGTPIASFDSVVANGVIGWGIETEDDVRQSFRNAHTLLRPGGSLLLGWNSAEYRTNAALIDNEAQGVVLPDRTILGLVRDEGFDVREIGGVAVFTGPPEKPWDSLPADERFFHRYVMAGKRVNQ
jgi:SAM-dependent methyltransferase